MSHREGNSIVREGFIYIKSGSKTDAGVAKDKAFALLGIEPGTPWPKSSMLLTRLSLQPIVSIAHCELSCLTTKII